VFLVCAVYDEHSLLIHGCVGGEGQLKQVLSVACALVQERQPDILKTSSSVQHVTINTGQAAKWTRSVFTFFSVRVILFLLQVATCLCTPHHAHLTSNSVDRQQVGRRGGL
jgi:hypothetical protein